MPSAPGVSRAELGPIAPAILAAGLLVAQQVAGKATRDAFFLSQFPVTALPVMSMAAARVSVVAVLAFARGMAALSPGRPYRVHLQSKWHYLSLACKCI